MQKLKRIKKCNKTYAKLEESENDNCKNYAQKANGMKSYSYAMCQLAKLLPNWTTAKQEKNEQTKCSSSSSSRQTSARNSSKCRNQHSVPQAVAATTTTTTVTLSAKSETPTSCCRSCSCCSSIWPQRLSLHLAIILIIINTATSVKADETTIMSSRISRYITTPLSNHNADDATTTPMPAASSENEMDWQPINGTTLINLTSASSSSSTNETTTTRYTGSASDSIFLRFARRLSTGNELWDGLIRDCYTKPSFTCFQKNVYSYLNDALDVHDVNITQRVKFYKNHFDYDANVHEPTESAKDAENDEEQENDIRYGRAFAKDDSTPLAETPIEEVTNALYGKSIKFAMTHDMELQLPEMMFDGATFRISPRSIEGNGIIAKLELIPKQVVEARLAGKILMKKIQKFLRSKLLLSFLALLVIIKIIKIKLFWLLPLIVGVGAAKKLLLKFLLFLFPALSHLFKLCSYYQQSYHTTKYHHHHHLINHHHTVVPPWHSEEHHGPPEIIYTNPPKGHISAYLHGAPIHETYGPHGLEHIEGAWENSGPGLGNEYISDINRVAQIEDNTNYFKPHTANDVNELHAWGLGTTTHPLSQQQPKPQQLHRPQQRLPNNNNNAPYQQQQPQQQRPSAAAIALHKQQQQQQPQQQQPHQQNYHKIHASSHSFNPFQNQDKQSNIFASTKLKNVASATQSGPNPIYASPPRNPGNGNVLAAPPPPLQASGVPHNHATAGGAIANGLGAGIAAQIAAQYDPARNNPQSTNTAQLSPEIKEAIRIQAEQRIIAEQQKILQHQPFVQDGEPLYPKNYDPFYSPILLKIDKILEQLGVTDDLCKERLVCSMYKDPTRYSPHSNFLSAELSRDTSELAPVSNTNEAVLRFYRLIQAAREGQDQKDCLILYPQCRINTE